MSDTDSSKQLFPYANPKCTHLMLRDYLCIGCAQLVHWFCAVGNQLENFLWGHGVHYCSPPCYSSGITPTVPSVQDSETDRVLNSPVSHIKKSPILNVEQKDEIW
jgi:hypothetical protein